MLDVKKLYRLCKNVEYLYYVLIDYCLLSYEIINYDKLYNNVIKIIKYDKLYNNVINIIII